MSIEPKQTQISLADKLGARARSKTSIARSRPYYSPDNAMVFKPTFDRMISGKEDLEILTTETGLKPSTLFIRAQDALKWLTDFDVEKEKYQQLRLRISITRQESPEGIALYFKPTIANIINVASGTKQEHTAWRDKLVEWLATAQSGELWDSSVLYPKGIVITTEDGKWLAQLLSSLEGSELDVKRDSIKVLR